MTQDAQRARGLARGFPAILLALSCLAWVTPAESCSTCKCGDPTITLFGVEKPYANRFRLSVGFLLRSETQGDPSQLERTTDEMRTTFGASYTLNPKISFGAQLPVVHKEVEDSNLGRQEASGIGDVDLSSRLYLYGTREHLFGLALGARLPTSEEVDDSRGRRIDIDAQPDAGAFAPNFGIWYGYFLFPWLLNGSSTYFYFFDGRQGFEPGSALLTSVTGQYGFGQRFALQLGVDTRWAERNHFSGVVDPDSGGFLAMLSPSATARLFEDLLVFAGVQVPVIEALNGEQEEDVSFRTGVTYDF